MLVQEIAFFCSLSIRRQTFEMSEEIKIEFVKNFQPAAERASYYV